MTVSDVSPCLAERPKREQVIELLTRARASVELVLVSRHLWPLDREQAEKASEYMDALRDLLVDADDRGGSNA